jgi:hypothetical protein
MINICGRRGCDHDDGNDEDDDSDGGLVWE